MLAIACGVTVNLSRRSALPWKGEWAKHVENRAGHAGIKLVGLGAMKQIAVTKSSLVFDARSAADFRAGHFPGARSIPIDQPDIMLAAMQIEMAHNQPVITYCARNDCDEGTGISLAAAPCRLRQCRPVRRRAGRMACRRWRRGGSTMKAYIQLGVRLLIVLLFIVACLPKIMTPQDFALVLFRYHLLPDNLINPSALLLPWMEGIAALALLLPGWRRAGTLWLVGMLLVTTAAIAISLARGLDIDCGCFTLRPGHSHISLWNIFRNLILLVLIIWSGWGKFARTCQPSRNGI